MTYKEHIAAAITELKDRNGSSAIAIKKLIQSKLPQDKKWANYSFLSALKSGVAAGEFVQIKSSYKLAPNFKKSIASKDKKAAAPKKAAPKKATATKKSAPKKKTATKKTTAPKKTTTKKITAPKKSAPEKKATVTAPKKSAPKKATTTKKTAPKKKAAPKKVAAPKKAAPKKAETAKKD